MKISKKKINETIDLVLNKKLSLNELSTERYKHYRDKARVAGRETLAKNIETFLDTTQPKLERRERVRKMKKFLSWNKKDAISKGIDDIVHTIYYELEELLNVAFNLGKDKNAFGIIEHYFHPNEYINVPKKNMPPRFGNQGGDTCVLYPLNDICQTVISRAELSESVLNETNGSGTSVEDIEDDADAFIPIYSKFFCKDGKRLTILWGDKNIDSIHECVRQTDFSDLAEQDKKKLFTKFLSIDEIYKKIYNIYKEERDTYGHTDMKYIRDLKQYFL